MDVESVGGLCAVELVNHPLLVRLDAGSGILIVQLVVDFDGGETFGIEITVFGVRRQRVFAADISKALRFGHTALLVEHDLRLAVQHESPTLVSVAVTEGVICESWPIG